MEKKVAPRVGAWIETDSNRIKYHKGQVAPRVGAWIETTKINAKAAETCVAPRVGAWIETPRRCAPLPPSASHPVWVRGLKRLFDDAGHHLEASHPVWVRGLKLVGCGGAVLDVGVAPRVGAWIETETQIMQLNAEAVAPRVGAWIETRLV